MAAIGDLVNEWKAEAERLRLRYASEDLARLCEAHAEELERAITAAAEEELGLDQAAAESGYSKSQLRRRFPGRARIRRAELPRKPRPALPALVTAPGEREGVSGNHEARSEASARVRARLARTRQSG